MQTDLMGQISLQDSFIFGIFDSLPTLFTFQIGMSELIIKRTFIRRKPHTNLCRGSKIIDINLPDSENFFDVVMKEESHWGISRLILTIATFGHLFKRTFILYKKYRRLRLCKNYGPTATNQFAFFRFGSFDHRPEPGCHYNF